MNKIGTNKAWVAGILSGLWAGIVVGAQAMGHPIDPGLAAGVTAVTGTLSTYLTPHGG